MNKLFSVALLTTILLQTSLAQTTFKISSYKETPEAFKYLLLSNSEISKNDTLNEEIIDLVEPMLLDSVIERRRQHHKVFMVGWFIHAFGGYNWRAVNMKKQKFVGTVTHHGRSGKIEYSEYDINFDIGFHLKKYLWKDFTAYDLQKKYHRQDIRRTHHTNYKLPPFVRDTNDIESSKYGLDCELTPPHKFISQLNLFYPTLPGAGGLKEHSNFGTDHPSMGFYGVACLDCNHNCHPELHPYEWVWWLKATDSDTTTEKTWLVGIFHEGSNRLKKWSVNPMTGSISLPFAFNYREDTTITCLVKVDHLVYNKFHDTGLERLNLPALTVSTKETSNPFEFTLSDSSSFRGRIEFSDGLPTNGLQYWFDEINLDKQNKIVSGYLHMAVSAEDLYTTKITFTTKHRNAD